VQSAPGTVAGLSEVCVLRSTILEELPANTHNVHATPQTRNLSPEQVSELLAAGRAQVVDVREPYERAAGYIDGSRHVELARLDPQSVERDRAVVFVCRVGGRSAFATQAFARAGYDAYNLEGGLVEWVRRGLPLAPEDGYVADH
jgi:rhodanese-related sulfurtransferase